MLPNLIALVLSTSVVTPPANITTQGVPPIPASSAERVIRYTDFRSASLQDWSPTSREVLILTRFAEGAQVHRVRQPLGARTQLTYGPPVRDWTAPYKSAQFAPNRADAFVFLRDVGGSENMQIYRYDFATAKETLLTDGKSRNGGVLWSPKGDLFAYVSNRRNGKDMDVWVGGIDGPQSHRLAVQLEGGGWQASDLSRDGKQLLLLEYISVNESYLWLADVTTGEKRLLTPKGGEKVAYGEAAFSHDAKRVFVSSDRGTEFSQLAQLDVASGVEKALTKNQWALKDLAVSRDGRSIAYTLNEAGYTRLFVYDLRGRRSRQLKLPDGVVNGPKWSRDSREIGFTLANWKSPEDAYSVSVRDGKVTRWTESEVGYTNPSALPPAELVKWKSFDGLELSGFLYRPPARFTGPRPVLVSIHGGPESQSTPGFLGSTNYVLLELGMAVLLPNVRGSSGYGKTFVALDNGMKREDTYRDIEALFDWIGKQKSLDASSIIVTGGSYGGHMSLAIATRYSDRIKGAISVVGISSFITFLETTAEYRRDLRRVEYGDERDPQMRAFMERIAPMSHAAKIKKPLLLIQGRNDPRVPIGEADQMAKVVASNGVPVWYVVGNDEGHGFRKKQNIEFQMVTVARFLETLASPAKTQ